MPRLVPLLPFLLALPLIASEPPHGPARRPIAQPVPRQTSYARAPQIASDGSGFFGAWGDELGDISGARFTAGGDLADPVEFPVVTTWHGGEYPAIAWNGHDYAVLGSAGPLGVFAVRVTPAGEVKPGPEPIPDLFPQMPPSLAWNGAVYAYAAVSGYNTLRVAFLDANLSLIKVVRLSENINVRCAQVATDGSGFLAVWEVITDREDIALIQRFDSTGEAIGPPRQIKNIPLNRGGVLRPAVVWNGTHYFVVWTASSVEATLIGSDGMVEQPFVISTEQDALNASVGWDGHAHLITWAHRTDDISTPDGAIVYRPAAVVTTATGDVLESMSIVFDVPAPLLFDAATIASNGSVFLVGWFGKRFVIDSTGLPGIRKQFSSMTSRYQTQSIAALATGSSNILAAWIEGTTMYAGRLSKRGDPLDGGGFAIGSSPSYAELRIAFTNGVYLVCWRQPDSRLFAVRVTDTGTLLDPQPIALATTLLYAHVVAAHDGRFRIIWSRWNGTPFPGRVELVTTEVPAQGPVDVRVFGPLLPSDLHQLASALVFTGNGYTLIWTQTISQPCYGSRCPPEQFESRVTTMDLEGKPLATRTVLANTEISDVVRAPDDTLLIAYWSQALYTQRMKKDGSFVGDRHLIPGGSYAGDRLAVVPAGFVLINATRFRLLDHDGVPVSSETPYVEGSDVGGLIDVTSDGLRLWIVFGAGWRPRTTTTASIGRLYIRSMGPRTRIAVH